MSKTFMFNSGTIKLTDEEVIIEETSYDIEDLDVILYVAPTLISLGDIKIGENLVLVSNKDKKIAMDFVNQMEKMGVFVSYLRGECTADYIESSLSERYAVESLRIRDDKLYFISFKNDVYEIDVELIKSIWIAQDYITFSSSDEYDDKIALEDDKGEKRPFSIHFKKKYFDVVVKFAEKIESLGQDISINIMSL